MGTQVIYTDETIFPYDIEKDKDLFSQYSVLSLLVSSLPSEELIYLEHNTKYRVTIEKIV